MSSIPLSAHRRPVPPAHKTWHMTPTTAWRAQQQAHHYVPEAWPEDGFIHCTDEPDELLAVGNRYYCGDERSWLALQIDCEKIDAPVVYEDEAGQFPHIYGPLPVAAVDAVVELERDNRGRFVAFGRNAQHD